MSNSEHFHSNIDSREYRINYSFNYDSSNVVYLLECTVCGVQYVGSTCTPFRLRFNNYKACSRKFNSGASVPQVEFFRHFTEEGHHGFLKDISVKIITHTGQQLYSDNLLSLILFGGIRLYLMLVPAKLQGACIHQQLL